MVQSWKLPPAARQRSARRGSSLTTNGAPATAKARGFGLADSQYYPDNGVKNVGLHFMLIGGVRTRAVGARQAATRRKLAFSWFAATSVRSVLLTHHSNKLT